VLEDLSDALDAGDRAGFLDAVATAAAEHPALAPDAAAAASLLAPWLAGRVAEAALHGTPHAGQAAPAVLAAVLTAVDGRRSKDVGAAVRRAAPQADGALLAAVETVFADAVRAGTSGGFMAAELSGLPLDVARAIAAGRAANGRAARRGRSREALAPLAPPPRLSIDGVEEAEPPPILRQDPILESRFRVPSGS
jgi:hypothetical protein